MLEKQVLSYIVEKGLFVQGDKVVVGVSGGPDSLALLYFLHSISSEIGITLTVAHVDHMFRGETSFGDYRFVEASCEEIGVPFEGKRIDVPAYIKQTRTNMQQASRDCRYAFFREVMVQVDANKLALAHHLDDQAETIVMSLVRGVSGRARAGIPLQRSFENGTIVRPFLAVSRMEIEHYCERHNLEPRMDESNQKDTYTRNRFRKNVLPVIKRENPKALENIQRYSEEIEAEETWMQSIAEESFNKLIMHEESGILTISTPQFLAMPIPLQRRVIHLILNYLYKVKPFPFSYVHVNGILSLILLTVPSKTIQLPGNLLVTKAYNDLLFHFEPIPNEFFEMKINIPGITVLPNGDIIEAIISPTYPSNEKRDDIFVLEKELYQFPIIVRNRRDGDRIIIKGLNGRKKLKKVFIENKIPIHLRKNWPVICIKESGEVLWVPGLQKGDAAQRFNSDSYIILKYLKQSTSYGGKG